MCGDTNVLSGASRWLVTGDNTPHSTVCTQFQFIPLQKSQCTVSFSQYSAIVPRIVTIKHYSSYSKKVLENTDLDFEGSFCLLNFIV